MQLVAAHTASYLPSVRQLFEEYAAELQADLDFQGFSHELAELPGKYAPPRGALLLAIESAHAGATAGAAGAAPSPLLIEPHGLVTVLGCVALRPLNAQTCEMKRLYVRPAARGRGLGRALSEAIIDTGRSAGYRHMWLDTLSLLKPALELYRALGFKEIPPYYSNPLPGVLYLGLEL